MHGCKNLYHSSHAVKLEISAYFMLFLWMIVRPLTIDFLHHLSYYCVRNQKHTSIKKIIKFQLANNINENENRIVNFMKVARNYCISFLYVQEAISAAEKILAINKAQTVLGLQIKV